MSYCVKLIDIIFFVGVWEFYGSTARTRHPAVSKGNRVAFITFGAPDSNSGEF